MSHCRLRHLLGLILGGLLPLGNFAPAEEKTEAIAGPVSPRDSLNSLVTHPDLKVELVACEPQVVDPVAMAFDEQGRLWVAEMRDYPNGPAPGESPKSRIKLLKDQDGDGFYETAEVFADNLLFANGVQPWKGGVIVTMSGKVAYFQDENGDGIVERETWFTGFTEENPQLRANHPTFGLDNQVYIANGLRGGVVAKIGGKPISISGRDFRFDPLSETYAAISGVGQFGLDLRRLRKPLRVQQPQPLETHRPRKRISRPQSQPRREPGRQRCCARRRSLPRVSADQSLDDLDAACRPIHGGLRGDDLSRRRFAHRISREQFHLRADRQPRAP